MINNKWDSLLNEEYKKDYFIELMRFIDNEYNTKVIYPKRKDLFNAFKNTDFDNIKVVIIGQDPYHEVNQAHGYAFSTLSNKRPSSLNNIFKELYNDLGIIRVDNNLSSLATQGVLLLNTILTVEEGKALSHKNKGWEIFTDNIIKLINEKRENVVFILWGNNAIKKETLISEKKCVIKSVHPSGLSANRGFFNSRPFSKTNDYLQKHGISKINWQK